MCIRDSPNSDPDPNPKSYQVYQQTSNLTPASTIRDMLKVVSDREPIPIEDVEPVEAIMKRFVTGGMSLGALSREAHETLAMGVNRAVS